MDDQGEAVRIETPDEDAVMTGPESHALDMRKPIEDDDSARHETDDLEDDDPSDDGEDAPEDEADTDETAETEEPQDQAEEAEPEKSIDTVRMIEAILFASAEPVPEKELASRLPKGTKIGPILEELQALYEPRGVNLVQVAEKWAFRTAPDLGFLLQKERTEQRRLSRAAIETLAIIAYHQPVTRAEIEELRGVTVSKGTLDVLLDMGWVRMRGRRQVPGRPLTYGTSDAFLEHFGLAAVTDLPGLEELKAAGLLDWRLPPDFQVPTPPGEGQGDGDGDFDEDPDGPYAEDDGFEEEEAEDEADDGFDEEEFDDGAVMSAEDEDDGIGEDEDADKNQGS